MKEKKSNKKFGYYFKLILRCCLFFTFFILLSIFGVFLICLGDSVYNSKKGIFKEPLLSCFIIVTESMVPTINVNDAIVVRRVKDNTVNVGDIITFSSNDLYFNGLTVTHRVSEKYLDEDGNYIYRTKGDNNVVADTSLVDLNQIHGKVIFKIPKIGYIQRFVSSTFGFVLSIIVPVVGVIIYELYRIIKVFKQKYDEVEIL